ncbi:AAA family ATPase [Xanthomonas arboricola]|uniref:AAA family ATPase n=1 Tax=Xanthomonas arboricola TaxID=56448 RepID=UPI000E0EC7DD|nr:ATP-binding protein [Xanthomonas arboricola]
MSNADQIKALVKSYRDGDDEHFLAVALQLAAAEAKRGHFKAAEDIKHLVDSARSRKPARATPLHQPRGELAALLQASYPNTRVTDLVASARLSSQLQRVIKEQRYVTKISAHGLSARRKLLLVGPPGTGKTLTASALAGELGIPLLTIRLDALITKFLGETATRLRQVFEAIEATRGVYFFDEFDAIGSQRSNENDVGEARRILNSFLQMLEQDTSSSLILAATNHPNILDHALLRRFDDILSYELPDTSQISSLLKNRLNGLTPQRTSWANLASQAEGLSYAEIVRAADDAIKETLISNEKKVQAKTIGAMIAERHAMHSVWTRL